MKKSKVLIPAMALLLFSTAASITGTVAWFTSTRVFESQVGTFAVGQLDGNLECTVYNGIATTLNGTQNIDFNENSFLGDASFCHTGTTYKNHLFTDIPGDTGNNFQDLGAWNTSGNAWDYSTGGTIKYYYAATWKYTFHYTYVAEPRAMNLFFDVNNSSSEWTKNDPDDNEETLSTAQGFRLGFFTTSDAFVWAPYRAYATSHTYVSNVTGAPATYTEHTDMLDSSAITDTTNYDLGSTTASQPSTKGNYLGTFALPGASDPKKVDLDVNMVAWYEGTDPSIVTSASTKMQKVAATLKFTVRSTPAA